MHRQGPAGKKGADGEAEATGRNPTDRGKSGTKRHLLTDGRGLPLAIVLTGAHRHDMKRLDALLDGCVIARPEEPPKEGFHLCLDRGYAYQECRQTAETRGYTVHIPPPVSEATPLPPPGDPGRHPARRWVVEVCHSWFNRFRRVLIRWEKRAKLYLGFVQLAASLIIYRKLRRLRALSG
jgi:putative transposase